MSEPDIEISWFNIILLGVLEGSLFRVSNNILYYE